VGYRKYKDLGHGFGLGTGTSAEGGRRHHPVLGKEEVIPVFPMLLGW
jgi:hypothetical protein